MKSQSVIFSALLVASFVAAGPAASKVKDKARLPAAQLASAQVGGAGHKDAWTRCQSQYDGQRFFLGRDRYAYIEQCFHNETGMYPHQAKLNCTINRC
jgi:hypothetical protein